MVLIRLLTCWAFFTTRVPHLEAFSLGAMVDTVTHTRARACSAYTPRARTEMATASQFDDGDADDDEGGGGGAKVK